MFARFLAWSELRKLPIFLFEQKHNKVAADKAFFFFFNKLCLRDFQLVSHAANDL